MKKKMKSVVVMVLGFALTGAVLTGCGKDGQKQQEETQIQQEETISQEEEAQEGAQEETQKETQGEVQEETQDDAGKETVEENGQAAGYEDNFAVDSNAAKEFAQKVKDAVANKDLEALADLTAFPVYVGLPDVNVVNSREDFLNLGGDAVFTQALVTSIENADIENFQPSMAGFSISDGGSANINFGVVDGALGINGINY